MKCAVLALTAAFAALCAMAAEYDVTRYGAKPDGKSDNTAAIQKAIDDCAAKGGGRVLVPGGGKYVTYTLNLKNDVELHIDRGATLLGGEDPFKYPVFETNAVWNAERSPRFNRRAMFYTVGQTNVAITGAGTIDGNAEKFHHEEKHNNWTGYRWFRNSHTNITGRCVFFVGCRDVRLDDVLILHPAGWSTWFLDCDRVGVRGVRIEADRRFPNGDGLHFGGCRDVTVSDCIVHSQDDALILRTHQEQMKKPPASLRARGREQLHPQLLRRVRDPHRLDGRRPRARHHGEQHREHDFPGRRRLHAAARAARAEGVHGPAARARTRPAPAYGAAAVLCGEHSLLEHDDIRFPHSFRNLHRRQPAC